MKRVLLAALVALSFVLVGSVEATEKTTYMIQMPDGPKLATDVYLPPGKDKKWPLILVRTPYGRDNVAKLMSPFFYGKPYALVVQDVRGRYGSDGISTTFLEDASDGYETVEWLARQPFSSGKIGTAGISAMGITQYLMHKTHPPHLACQNVMAAPESLYHTIAYQGGSVRRGLFYGWVMGQKFPVSNMYMILQHMNYDDLWEALSIAPDYNKINVPILHMAGWYDLYLRGNLEAFKGIQNNGAPGGKGKQRLIIGPWMHGNFAGITGTKVVDLTYPSNSRYEISKVFSWFDECLNGRDKGFQKGPAVRYYTMGDVDDKTAPGNMWRSSDVWPVPAKDTAYYLHPDGLLSRDKPTTKGGKTIVDDPANPVPTLGSTEHSEERHPVDLRPIESRKDVLVFSTPVLKEPVEVTGYIKAKLSFTTDVVDTDFNVRLVDVYPDGRSMLVTDGVARASKRKSDRYRVPLKPGEKTELWVDMWATSLIFNKGHRIKVIVSGSNFPRFDINFHNGRFFDLGKGELEKAMETSVHDYVYKPDLPEDYKVANTTVHMSPDAASAVVLPIVFMQPD